MTVNKKHRSLALLCLLTMLVLLAGCSDTPKLSSSPEVICGTYTTGMVPDQKILSVDQENNCFIRGEVQKKEGNVYAISCQESLRADWIPDQEFTYDGKNFSLTIQGSEYTFEKTDDIPAIIGDEERYI